MKTYWTWATAIPVTLEELAEVACGDRPPADVLAYWSHYGDGLDAYIIPGDYPSIGVRYGNKGREYLSLCIGDRSKLDALIDKRFMA